MAVTKVKLRMSALSSFPSVHEMEDHDKADANTEFVRICKQSFEEGKITSKQLEEFTKVPMIKMDTQNNIHIKNH